MAEEPQRPGGGAGRAGSGRAGSGRTSGGRPSRARREATPGSTGPSRPKVERPPLPEGVDWLELDVDVRGQLRSLPKSLAETVGSHLYAAGMLLDEDADAAYAHALTARRLASRVAAAREAAGVTAYRSGRWSEAVAELRAYRRMTGSEEHLPLLADAERALGRPERALELADTPATRGLDPNTRAELLLVVAGARRDLGQLEAALVELQGPAQRSQAGQEWAARLRYAYADALLAADRVDEAVQWFEAAAQVDPEGRTDAEDRLLALSGVVIAEADDSAAGPAADEVGDR